MNNLAIAFPDKSIKERKKIAKEFYGNLIDTFIETIKLISISAKEFDKRFIIKSPEVLKFINETNQSVQFHSGHFFNWEFVNLGLAKNLSFSWLGVYIPVANKVIDKIILKMRSKFGTILIPATTFRTKFHQYANTKYALGLAADQNPGSPDNNYWLLFFNKLTPFVKGPEKGAKRNNTIVVLTDFYKERRGYYAMELKVLTDKPNETVDGAITKALVSFIENAIKERPANYLWSHRRWKHQFNEEKHHHLLVK
jgi:KDO2-lipid IV(A) lauroyltransferase